jgi:hypothetical protein
MKINSLWLCECFFADRYKNLELRPSRYASAGGSAGASAGASAGGSAGAAGYAYLQYVTRFPTIVQGRAGLTVSGSPVAIAATLAGSTVIVFCGSGPNTTATTVTLNSVAGTRLTGTSSTLWSDVYYWTNVAAGITSYTPTNSIGLQYTAMVEIGNAGPLFVGPATSDLSGTATTFSSTSVPNLYGQQSLAFVYTDGSTFATFPSAPWSTSTPNTGAVSLYQQQATSNLGNNTAVWTGTASKYGTLNVNVTFPSANFFPFF